MAVKVLVVEDEEDFHRLWKEEVGNNVEILSAYSIQDAIALFNSNPDISMIVMDACVPGNQQNTAPLVKWLREKFKGPLIATSSVPCFRVELLKAGCSHESQKRHVPKKVLELLESGIVSGH
ncbi:MAG: hypothetical protein WC657_04275 [Candidatus Paceibacterota bacterium]|jgi:CheY-like chemotaxis protein